MKAKKRTILYITIFIIYVIINTILMLHHEPWRDEVHSWLMAKELNLKQLFIESKFDGHPILWQCILMPFAKLNFPIITLNIIGLIITSIATAIFIFKSKANIILKIFAVFSIPFTYVYSANARNYGLILLILMIISAIYEDRYKHSILYSILICLLIHTHSLAWGIVAGLTITFHFEEIYKYLKNKTNQVPIKDILIGLTLIIANTIIVIYELMGTGNTNYDTQISSSNSNIISFIIMLFIMLTLTLLYNIFILKGHYKEYEILFLGFAFSILIYTLYYPCITYQRYVLAFVYLLFYIVLIENTNKEKNKDEYQIIITTIYIALSILFAYKELYQTVYYDYFYNYSSAKEIGQYIDENIPKGTEILMEASIMEQSIIPYTDQSYSFYDITYNQKVTCANVSDNINKYIESLKNISKYKGKYIILTDYEVYKYIPEINNCTLIYETNQSITLEKYKLYYIN